MGVGEIELKYLSQKEISRYCLKLINKEIKVEACDLVI